MGRLAVAIAGATASGKTTLARAVADRVPCTILRTDDYYRRLDHLTFEQRCLQNFDHPDAIEHDLLVAHVRELLAGRTVEAPRYDFTRHTRFPETHTVVPSPVLLIEGLFALCFPELRELCAVRVFVDTPEDVCLKRRLARDVLERGRTPVEVMERFSGHVAPMFRQHVLPTRETASVVVSGTDDVVACAERVLAEMRRWEAAQPSSGSSALRRRSASSTVL
ncbi:MAG: uridine kinase [Fimbriimonadales bacterium]|nr:uridine kinase [Fimbriimonadales bacterium]